MNHRQVNSHSITSEPTIGAVMPPRRSTIPLDRLLDGVDVDVEPLVARHATPGGRHHGAGDSGVIELACGALVRLSEHSVTIVPPPRAARAAANGTGPRPIPIRPSEPSVSAGVRIRVRYQSAVNLFDQLGEPLVEKLGADDPIRHCFRELVDEMAAWRPGRRAMAEALVRRMLLLVLRRCVERAGAELAWAAALEDTRLGRAVAAMRERPGHAFTLTELAEVAGMSRTVFAARFAAVLAQPPIEFLKTLRLARAAKLLTRTELPIKAIAGQVGYSSRSSFTRAFVARHGAAPQAFRDGAPEPAAAPAPSAPHHANGGPRPIDRLRLARHGSSGGLSPGQRARGGRADH